MHRESGRKPWRGSRGRRAAAMALLPATLLGCASRSSEPTLPPLAPPAAPTATAPPPGSTAPAPSSAAPFPRYGTEGNRRAEAAVEQPPPLDTTPAEAQAEAPPAPEPVAVLPAPEPPGTLATAVPDRPLSRLATTPGGAARAVVDRLDAIRFANDRPELDDAARAQLGALAARLAGRSGDYVIEIQAHSDGTGGDQHNLRLSFLRGEVVRDYLVSRLGIATGRFAVLPLGASQPAAGDATADGRARNRRVTVLVLE